MFVCCHYGVMVVGSSFKTRQYPVHVMFIVLICCIISLNYLFCYDSCSLYYLWFSFHLYIILLIESFLTVQFLFLDLIQCLVSNRVLENCVHYHSWSVWYILKDLILNAQWLSMMTFCTSLFTSIFTDQCAPHLGIGSLSISSPHCFFTKMTILLMHQVLFYLSYGVVYAS